MKQITLLLVAAMLASPAVAQSSIKGIDLSPEEAGLVQRQCNALAARANRSLAADDPEPPPPGVVVSDPAGFWASGADAMDEALTGINLGSITLRDCRRAGFH